MSVRRCRIPGYTIRKYQTKWDVNDDHTTAYYCTQCLTEIQNDKCTVACIYRHKISHTSVNSTCLAAEILLHLYVVWLPSSLLPRAFAVFIYVAPASGMSGYREKAQSSEYGKRAWIVHHGHSSPMKRPAGHRDQNNQTANSQTSKQSNSILSLISSASGHGRPPITGIKGPTWERRAKIKRQAHTLTHIS